MLITVCYKNFRDFKVLISLKKVSNSSTIKQRLYEQLEEIMDNDLKLNVLQDFVDINGGTFRLNVKWYDGKLYIDQEKGHEGGVAQLSQIPVSPTIDADIKKYIFKKMPGLRKITVNKVIVVEQDVKKMGFISMQNKFKQSIDFELVLNSNRPASIQMYTHHGIERLEHDFTYVRALFTTNPYFATVFNGIRIVPYDRDIEDMGNIVVQTVKAYAKKLLSEGGHDNAALEFKIVKAFEVSFYLNDQDVTEDIHNMMNKKENSKTTLDEFGFIAYIAYYQVFEGELNNQVALTDL